VQNRNTRAVVVALGLAAGACAPAATGFDAVRARAHLDMLAGTIGSRPAGTPANHRAREYIAAQLTGLGFTVRIQDAIAVNERFGVSTRVANIIAVRDGVRREAIALVSHYDSAPEASGAIDDGIGVATAIEAARVLSGSRLTHSLMVLVTDAEEFGLMGARVLVKDAEVADRMRVFLNFDNTGAAGPSLLYEVSQGLGAHLSAWAGAAPAPSGASFAAEIYSRLPNDTDFSVLKRTGAAGLNFAVIGDAYAYHTDRDVPQRVRSATLQTSGDNTVAIVRALDARDTAAGPVPATYFDVAGSRGVAYGPGLARAILWIACVAGAFAWILVTRHLWRARRLWGIAATLIWTKLVIVVAAGAGVLAALAIRMLRTETNPYYASPQWYYLWMATAALAAAALVARVAAIVPERLQPSRGAPAVWWVALPLWIAAAIAAEVLAPTATYLVALPLLVAAPVAVIATRWRFMGRLAALVVLALSAALSAGKVLMLMAFVVPLFGWLPVAPPVWVHPALIALAASLYAPPLLALISSESRGRRGRWLATAAMALALVLTGTAAFTAPAYSRDRPERRVARYIQDDARQRAWFEVGGPEPALGLATGGPAGAVWENLAGPRILEVPPEPIDPLPAAFGFRTATAPIVASAPAGVKSTFSQDASGRLTLELEVTAHEPIAVEIVFPMKTPLDDAIREAARNKRPPDGSSVGVLVQQDPIIPRESSIAGVAVGEWHATFIAPPIGEPMVFRFAFDEGVTREALAGTVVVLTSRGLPGGTGPLQLPAWLPQERATWRARSHFVLPVK
jgi:peptidase M28-like protein